jgi:hypothetical protein
MPLSALVLQRVVLEVKCYRGVQSPAGRESVRHYHENQPARTIVDIVMREKGSRRCANSPCDRWSSWTWPSPTTTSHAPRETRSPERARCSVDGESQLENGRRLAGVLCKRGEWEIVVGVAPQRVE